MATLTRTLPNEQDTHAWALQTAQAIRDKRWNDIDWDAVADELDSVAKREKRELRSLLARLIYHLLKTEFQPERKTRSWILSIENSREELQELLAEEPSLKPYLLHPETIKRAYRAALAEAGRENLPDSIVQHFPPVCPYTIEMLLPNVDDRGNIRRI